MTYTRDKLLGAVEKVRSGMLLTRASPYLGTPTSILTTPRATPIDPQAMRLMSQRRTPVDSQIDKNIAGASDMPPSIRSTPRLFVSPSRASITSASSGRGSAAHESRIHYRGDSFQEPSSSTVQQTTSSSSGFASRTLSSQLQSSQSTTQSPGQSSGISASGSTSGAPTPRIPLQRDPMHRTFPMSYYPSSIRYQLHHDSQDRHRNVIESPQSEPNFPHLDPLDISVDENYEFDTGSPGGLESDLRKEQQLKWKQSQLYGHQHPYYQHQVQQSRVPFDTRNIFSDSEIYSSYPSPSRRHHHQYKYDDTEARCAALKEEFLRFRRKQQMLRREQRQGESSSDEFESAC